MCVSFIVRLFKESSNQDRRDEPENDGNICLRARCEMYCGVMACLTRVGDVGDVTF